MVILVAAVGILLLALLVSYLAHGIRVGPARKPEVDTGSSAEPSYSLPTKYDEDEIVAMVKDPNWLYTYWEVTDKKEQDFSAKHGKNAWQMSEHLLRVHDVTHPNVTHNLAGSRLAVTLDTPYTDISVNDYSSCWYVNVGKPNHSYCIDLGRRLPSGEFVTLVRSNVVTMPANQVSNIIDPLWPPLEGVWGSLAGWPGERGAAAFKPAGLSSPELIVGSESLGRRKE